MDTALWPGNFLGYFAASSIVLLGWRRPLLVAGGFTATAVILETLQSSTPSHSPDGVESALARVIVALTDTTMECVRRASVSDTSPVRHLELNYAMKGALILSALTKAFDSHRDGLRHPKKTQ